MNFPRAQVIAFAFVAAVAGCGGTPGDSSIGSNGAAQKGALPVTLHLDAGEDKADDKDGGEDKADDKDGGEDKADDKDGGIEKSDKEDGGKDDSKEDAGEDGKEDGGKDKSDKEDGGE